ncbi:class I SAM-dependent methyltransferase [uncultured Sphaerochaeta sp.]|uniref:class I SAM-dependent methyltransferase n=1 Tax=uncultured Sphaerochaeta sp. TaxID=886478 RepID=UPI002A0A4C75|nr:class I SAM-dependent methyltransferase [uncultured Sphaerochaeta sp.]
MLATAIDRSEVVSFFDSQAPTWDFGRKPCPKKLESILSFADIQAGDRILDVACGTGVLFPCYLSRKVTGIVGVDISSNMIARAREKYKESCIELYNLDIEQARFDQLFDKVMLFNALPHFPSPGRLVEMLATFTKVGGRLTIAHDMGRVHLNSVHCHKARGVSLELIGETELASLLSSFFTVDIVRSDKDMYVVSGIRNRL